MIVNLNLHFTWEEKVKFLQELGYEVRNQREIIAYVYHNDEGYDELTVSAVYFLENEFEKPSFRNRGEYEFKTVWLDQVFEKIIRERLKSFLLKNT